MKKPLIGIPASIRVLQANGLPYYAAYPPNVAALEKAGALPVLIPNGISHNTLRDIYEQLDAVLLPGGGDVDPVIYGAEKHPATANIDPMRDDTEIMLARWAAEDDRPLFGICRGHQVINVAFGGTLIQDIPSQCETTIAHDAANTLPRSHRVHPVTIDASSRLAGIVGKSSVVVNSWHHQSVQQPAPSARVIAYAPDGVVEGLEFPDKRFALSVQWHPEDLPDDESAQALFKAFVDAARERSTRP